MEKDVEASTPQRMPWLKMVLDQGIVTDEIKNYAYKGAGTDADPYIVEWIDHDPRNPMTWSQLTKWSLTALVAIATLAVAFVSSAYSGGVAEIQKDFGASEEVNILGISLFVMGFAIGPLLWAPLSELFGRQYLFFGTYAMLTVFNAAATGAKDITSLIVFRFLAGAFGSSPLTNAGGVIADMFSANQRGLATTLFASAPFLGPTLGPIVGGFVGETVGWRWIEGVMAIFTGVVWIAGAFLVPETYSPVLLRQRAARLSKLTGQTYRSRVEAEQGKVSASHAFKTALSRPWILLFTEPIVLLLSIYMAIVYGTLYMMFAAFPIVFQEYRGWSQGVGGLAFLGVAVGMMAAVAYATWDNTRYIKAANKDPSGFAPPEARLPPCMVGGLCLPIGLFWFAWSNSPSVPWIVCIIGTAPFGFGMVLVFLGIMNYLIDSYTIFAASVLAANSVLRSLFGAAFPLFTTQMYANLGIHWASSIPAFLALACVSSLWPRLPSILLTPQLTPFPFLFYIYGPRIRAVCKYAAEADIFMRKMRGQMQGDEHEAEVISEKDESASSGDGTAEDEKEAIKRREAIKQRESEREAEAYDYSNDDVYEKAETSAAGRHNSINSSHSGDDGDRFATLKAPGEQASRSGLRQTWSKTSLSSVRSNGSTGFYEGNPYDLDRVNTKDSFGGSRPRSGSRSVSYSGKGKKSSKLASKS